MNTTQTYTVLADNIIKYRTDKHYGTTHYYIVSEHAKQIQTLTNRKTLVERDRKALEQLGFVFEQVL